MATTEMSGAVTSKRGKMLECHTVRVGNVYRDNETFHRTGTTRELQVVGFDTADNRAILKPLNRGRGCMKQTRLRLKALGSAAKKGFTFLRHTKVVE